MTSGSVFWGVTGQAAVVNVRIRPNENLTAIRFCSKLLAFLSFAPLACGTSMAQTAQVFRLDGGNITYAFGVNKRRTADD